MCFTTLPLTVLFSQVPVLVHDERGGGDSFLRCVGKLLEIQLTSLSTFSSRDSALTRSVFRLMAVLDVWSGLLTWRIGVVLGRLWSCRRKSISGCRMSCSTRMGSNGKSPALAQPERMFRVVKVALRARSYNRARCCSPSCWPFCDGAAPPIRGTFVRGLKTLTSHAICRKYEKGDDRGRSCSRSRRSSRRGTHAH